jgi:hypothetical protein
VERKTKILKLVKGELEDNLQKLRERGNGEVRQLVFVKRFKNELWKAFPDGGELRWIRDLQLLDALATAYHFIAGLVFLEDKYAEYLINPTAEHGQSPHTAVRDLHVKLDPLVEKHVEVALKAIEESLSSVERDTIAVPATQ